jgi:hypothetical protein
MGGIYSKNLSLKRLALVNALWRLSQTALSTFTHHGKVLR